MAYFSLLSVIKKHFQWQLKLLGYSLRHEARSTIFEALFQVFSKFSQLFLLFIPLKIILILSSNSLPSSLPGSNIQLDQNTLLVGLAITMFILLILALLFDLSAQKIAVYRCEQLSQLIAKSNKASEEMQKSIRKILANTAKGNTNITYFILCITGILIVNPAIFIIVVLVLPIQLLAVSTIFMFDEGILGRFKIEVQREPSSFLKYLASVNFFIVFLYLLVNYMLSGEIDSTNAILTLLLSRGMFKSLSQFAAQIVKLEQKQTDIDSVLVVNSSR